MAKCIGIDLGNSFFRVSYLNEINQPKLISDEQGKTFFPSKVAFLQGGGCRIGYDAELFGVPENTIMHPISIIGLPFPELQRLNNFYVYQFLNEHGEIVIDAHRVFPTIMDFISTLLFFAKTTAEKYLGETVTEAVIALPDGFNDIKRVQILQAAKNAGLQTKQLLNQTVAAALGYGFYHKGTKKIAVIDVGSSHTTMSMLMEKNNQLEVIETRHCEIGTLAFEKTLINLVCRYGLKIEDPFVKNEINLVIKEILPELSCKDSVEISINGIGPRGTRFIMDVSRQEFECLITPELAKIRNVIAPSASTTKIDVVLLIGGGANIPVIKQLVDEVYKKVPFSSPSIAPEAAIALGASIKSGIIDGIIDYFSIEKTVHDLGTFYRDNLMDVLIPRGTPLPISVSKDYGLNLRNYIEKVYQWTGNTSGQDHRENEKNLIVLANKRLEITGRGVRNSFNIDANGIAEFIVTDLGNNKQYILTGFYIK